MAMCSECDDSSCPGLIMCPACGIESHGIEAETHIADHGWCYDCQADWEACADWNDYMDEQISSYEEHLREEDAGGVTIDSEESQ